MPRKPRRNNRRKSFSSNTFQQLEDRRMLATFVVNNLLDAPISNPGEVPGSLRQAIFDANDSPGADTIVFEGFAASGEIPLSAGTLEVTDSVDIVGPGAADLTINAGGSSSIFQFGDAVGASTFGVSGLTLTGGNGQNNSGIGNFGGAVLFFDQFGSGGEDTLDISDTVITGNSAVLGGGLHSVLGALNVADTTFSGNNATQGSGEVGGGGLSLLQTDTTLERVTVDGNTASNLGGGITNFVDTSNPSLGDANLTVIDSTISNNTARGGGGILNVTLADSAEATVNVSGSSIVGNRASAVSGGGIRSDAGIVTVSNSLLENNTATNSGFDGGGILGINADIRVENTTLSNNRAADTAGSIFVLSDRSLDPENVGLSNLDIVNSTVTDSSGGTAIVVRANSNSTAIATHQNSIFADNSGANFGASGSGTTTVISAGHNISDDGTGNLTATGDQTNTDPLLLPLADNGGATLTHALRLESPAIDAGSNALAVDAAGNALATDQRGTGFDRVLDAAVDVGAFESELFQGDLIVSTNTDVVDNDFSSGELSLREAVLIANARDGVDTITFDSALSGQTITLTDDALTGELQVTESVDIIGPGASDLTISGDNTTGIFWFGDETDAATFNVSGIRLSSGNGETDAGLANRFGGAVLFFDQFGGDDTLNISDSTIVDSTAVRGGGLHALLGTLNITNSIIARNSATTSTAFLGGGGLSLEQSDTTLVRVTVADNSASSFGGGVINFAANDTTIEVDSNLTIIDSKIENNTAARGAGIQNITRTSLSEANLSVSNTAISGNDAQDFAGGGIRSEGGSVEVSNSLIFDNTTPLDGGGIFAVNADVRVENSTLSGNTAGDDGGAIFVQAELANDPAGLGTGTLDIVNSTIAFNTGSQGAITVVAAANSTNDATYQNSIFSNNSGANLTSFGSGTETLVSAGHNISDDTTGNLFTAGDQINTDPLLFPLADNGGLTQTHALQIGSPAIDAGNNALAVDADGNELTTDQRGEGFARILDGNPPTVDVGAFENKTFEGDIVVSENSDVVDSFTGVGQLSLREAILIANDRLGADSITFDSALNGETITLTEGELQVTESVDIAGPGANQLTVSGDEASTVFWFGDVLGASTFSVSGLTIADGNGQNDAGLGVVGGAVLFFDSLGNGGEDTLNISDSVVGDSTAANGGGLHSVLGTLNVTDTKFSGNASTTGALFEGGGGLSLQQTDATLERVTVSNNTANSFGGGIISFSPEDATASNDSRLTIIDSTISNNTAERAAGISNVTRTDSAEAILNVSGTTISDNTATAFAGGGIRSDGGSVTVSSSLISGNSTGNTGGAIFAVNADLLVENSTLSGNIASDGGAIFALADLGESTGDNDGQAVTNIASSTIAFNSGTRAVTVSAAANSVSSVTSANSIFSNHTGSTNFGSFGSGAEAIVSGGFNISDDATGNSTSTGDQPNTDPLLGPLADNGGLTQTHALQVGSPAIDAGNSALATDQRGFARPFDVNTVTNATGSDGSDIGAFEFVPPEEPSLVVTTNLDVVSEFDQVTSIREAIAFADSTPGEDTITFAPALSGSTIQLDSDTGPALLINDSLTIDASSLSGPLTIVGNGLNRVVNFADADGDLTIEGLTITGGVATNGASGGGILFNSSGELTILSSTISGNTAADDGGGIDTSFASVTVVNSTFNGNTSGDDGGGIRSGGSVTVIDSTFSGNTAADNGGGIQSARLVTVIDSIFSGNTAAGDGGGIDTGIASVIVVNSTISGNSADGDGGGIDTGSASVTVINSTISENSAGMDGGGIESFEAVTVNNSTISGNTAAMGGGIETEGAVRITNSTIVNNESQQGGAVFISEDTGGLFIENSIVANNVADGVANEVELTPGASLTINHSLIGNAEGVGTILGSVGNLTGTTANPLDPMLGELADNGGPTLTHALLPGSPAINAGDNALAVEANGNPLAFDQRGEGFDRIFGGTVDMGAFEADAADIVAPSVESIVINNGDTQRSMVNEITVSFSEVVNVSAGDFILQYTDTGANITPDVSTQVIGGKTVATLTFSGTGIVGGSLADGNYSLTVLDTITDTSGNVLDGDGDGSAGGNATDDFFRLYGDVNGDRTVNIIDFFQFRNAFGNSELDERFDFNGDGSVNILDFFQFRSRFGTSV